MIPPVLALFQKRIEGDDALLQLAALKFKKAGLGAEYYAETPDELDTLLRFSPDAESPATVHLPRWINLFEKDHRTLVLEFAEKFKERLLGIIIHDQKEIVDQFDDYLKMLREMESSLSRVEAPFLFLEYAVGLDPDLFIKLFRAASDLEHVSSCIDIGHIGIRHTRHVFSQKYPGKDICALKPGDPGLKEIIMDVEEAVEAAPAEVLRVILEIGSLRKPLHYHLHDAHPLSTYSPFGVSDHLSFLNKIMLPFEYMGVRSLDLMFGPFWLSRIVIEAIELLGPDHVSFMLEIHPTEGRIPLGDASYLFHHWQDKGNAERMNFWLAVLYENQQLILEAIKERNHERE